MPTDRNTSRIQRGRAALALALALAGGACATPEPAPFVPERDGAIARDDGGPLIVLRDASTSTRDGGPGDAGGAMDGATSVPITIDGVLDPGEWAGALEVTTATPPTSGFEGDRLERLLARRTATHLVIGVEGTIQPGHAMLLLLDADYGGSDGVVLTGAALGDVAGTLDRAISSPPWFTLLELRPDYAWGVTEMPTTVDGSSDVAGWRDIATDPDAFRSLTTSTRTACRASACETAILLGPGGIENVGEIALAVRISNGSSDLSNQTLPLDSPTTPEALSTVLRLPPPGTEGL
jgi:hypothetical protein